jgi:DNA-binding PadR family transcriptional regulator
MFSDPVSKSLEWSRKGYMGMALLLMINEKPLTGYDVMRVMRETTQGFWKPTPGGVYPVLKKLENEGLVHGAWSSHKGRKKKVYVITDDGRRTLDRVLIKQSEIALGINRLFESFLRDMTGLMNPHVAPPSIFTMFTSELMGEEIKELEARRETIMSLMESLQQCLDAMEKQINEKRKSTF